MLQHRIGPGGEWFEGMRVDRKTIVVKNPKRKTRGRSQVSNGFINAVLGTYFRCQRAIPYHISLRNRGLWRATPQSIGELLNRTADSVEISLSNAAKEVRKLRQKMLDPMFRQEAEQRYFCQPVQLVHELCGETYKVIGNPWKSTVLELAESLMDRAERIGFGMDSNKCAHDARALYKAACDDFGAVRAGLFLCRSYQACGDRHALQVMRNDVASILGEWNLPRRMLRFFDSELLRI